MKHSLKQVIQLELQCGYLLFERGEAAGQMASKRIRIETFQDFGTGKVGEVARACPVASFFERAVFFLAEPEYDYPVSRLAGHIEVRAAIASSSRVSKSELLHRL
jgi:hypothetical protein